MVGNSQGLPWIETINYKIDTIYVYIYVSTKDKLILYELIKQECKKWITKYDIFVENNGNHGSWNTLFKTVSRNQFKKFFDTKISLSL